jgi:hypothetical protein
VVSRSGLRSEQSAVACIAHFTYINIFQKLVLSLDQKRYYISSSYFHLMTEAEALSTMLHFCVHHEDSSLLGCYAAWLGEWFLIFQTNILS